MILIRKVQKPTRHPPLLEDIKQRQPLGHRQPIIQIIMDNEMRRIKAQDPLGAARVKAAVILPRLPERPIELALHEPQLLRGDLGIRDECPVVCDQRFEFPA